MILKLKPYEREPISSWPYVTLRLIFGSRSVPAGGSGQRGKNVNIEFIFLHIWSYSHILHAYYFTPAIKHSTNILFKTFPVPTQQQTTLQKTCSLWDEILVEQWMLGFFKKEKKGGGRRNLTSFLEGLVPSLISRQTIKWGGYGPVLDACNPHIAHPWGICYIYKDRS